MHGFRYQPSAIVDGGLYVPTGIAAKAIQDEKGRCTMRAIVVASGLLGLTWSLPASAHGCHHAWQQSALQGWHSHGAKCDALRGIGVSRRARPSNRRPA